ncbi:MAG: molecular chaperone HtpG, partial [Bacteroidota bacterium]|nr:molecular chaperone HtpG [Bacteroidota bacterium]
MTKGKINVTTENIFPLIKKFLYSDHEIFLRELVSNAVDASQKLSAMADKGDYDGEIENTTVRINADEKAKTLTISDAGIGMTADEIEKYINQIAFSSAEEFLDKYKDNKKGIIGHFGMGFYSAFMVADKVEIFSKSYKKGEKAVRWECDGSPEFTLEETDKKDRGTDIVLHISEDEKDFLKESEINRLLDRYSKFSPFPIAFGKKKEFKDGKQVETEEDNIINNTEPAWTKMPSELEDKDYKDFYKELYPTATDEPLFNIHLNVDYPFNLTGILYFPKLKNNIEIQRNKIQLYQHQVFVTDQVESIVPEFLTLLHGVLDSPDIPLNVSRSYLQSDRNVKKIANHITKKVADKLKDIAKNKREQFEEKWDYLKLFVEYGMLSDEKFYDKAQKIFLLKNTDGKYFTFKEYDEIVKDNQTDKDDNLTYLYTNDTKSQYSFINAAKDKGYDVLEFDDQLSSHLINHLETKLEKRKFVRVDSDITEKLIPKDEKLASDLSEDEESALSSVFQGQTPKDGMYMVNFEAMSAEANPALITQNEFMRRMKDMSKMSGEAGYGNLPDSYNLVINANHKLISDIKDDLYNNIGDKLKEKDAEAEKLQKEIEALETLGKDKKEEEIPQEEKDKKEELNTDLNKVNAQKDELLSNYGKDNNVVKQIVDLALLANNMLTGE